MPHHPGAQRPGPTPHPLTAQAVTRATAPVAASATDLTKVYGQVETRVTALDAVSVEFDRGRFTAIMGPSGSGKSTLMHCMAGLDAISCGTARIGDVELSSLGGQAAHPAAPRQGRLHLPGVQSDADAGGSPSPARWPPSPRSSSRTSPPETSTPTPEPRYWAFCARPSWSWARPW